MAICERLLTSLKRRYDVLNEAQIAKSIEMNRSDSESKRDPLKNKDSEFNEPAVLGGKHS